MPVLANAPRLSLRTQTGEKKKMVVAETTVIEKPCPSFIKEYLDDRCCLEIIRFFGEYPRTRFSRLAVIHALNVNGGGRFYIERALQQLVDKGVIRISTNNIPLYALTEDEPLRRSALALARLDWQQWQLVLTQIYPSPGQ